MRRPITIVGGGLAGLSLGIALRRSGVAVRLHEAGTYPRHRVCGEFICGVSQETLAGLGITGAFGAQTLNRDSEWFFRDRAALRQTLPVPAIGISRFHLDAWMAEEFVRLGGELQTGTRTGLDELPTEASVWCDGRRRQPGTRWLGLKCHARGFELRTDLQMHLGKGCYVGISRIEDGLVNVCGLFRQQADLGCRDRRELLLRYLRSGQLTRLADQLAGSAIDPDSLLGVSAFKLGRQPERGTPDDGQLQLGDAQSMIPPFTGNGMSMAFQSAELALAPLVAYANGDRSWHATAGQIRHAQHQRFGRRLRWAMRLHPWLLRQGGQRVLVSLSRYHLVPFGLLFKQTR